MAMLPVVHHPAYLVAGRHVDRLTKNAAIHNLLREHHGPIDWIQAVSMPRDWIEAVHDPDYVAEVLDARVSREKERRIGFAVTEAVALRSRMVAGGTWLAALIALERGFAANSAGGSHHALATTGAGYCVLNDLAIAAVRLVEERSVERVLIVDCDVHQGDGTAALTAGRAGIATYSIHAERNFPVRKARSTLDIGLPDGTGDAAYLEALQSSLGPLIEEQKPQLILYQAGVDPFAGDRLGRLALSQAGLEARDRLVAGLAKERGIALASTVGGGYDHDVMAVARRHVTSILTLASVLSPSVGGGA